MARPAGSPDHGRHSQSRPLTEAIASSDRGDRVGSSPVRERRSQSRPLTETSDEEPSTDSGGRLAFRSQAEPRPPVRRSGVLGGRGEGSPVHRRPYQPDISVEVAPPTEEEPSPDLGEHPTSQTRSRPQLPIHRSLASGGSSEGSHYRGLRSQATSLTESSDEGQGVVFRKWTWEASVYGVWLQMSWKSASKVRKDRGKWPENDSNVGVLLHDLLADSLVPLTEHKDDTELVFKQASIFFSAFTTADAHWRNNVDNLPHHQRDAIYGPTENSRLPIVGSRFMRFRFPLVRFEWNVESSYYSLSKHLRTKHRAQMCVMWKAWANHRGTSGLVASGYIKDELRLMSDQCPAIYHREFKINEILQPELMATFPYTLDIRHDDRQSDLRMILTTSQSVRLFLRSSQPMLVALVALSALATSLRPIVERASAIAGWVIAGIGIVAALTSVISVMITWSLQWSETNVARYRQGTRSPSA